VCEKIQRRKIYILKLEKKKGKEMGIEFSKEKEKRNEMGME